MPAQLSGGLASVALRSGTNFTVVFTFQMLCGILGYVL